MVTVSPSSRKVRCAPPRGERLLAAPAQLEERAALVALGAADRAGREQVAGPERGAVDGQVGEHLGGGPVHRGVRRPRDRLAVEHDLEVDVVARARTDPEVVQGLGVLAGQVDPGRLERLQRGDPAGDGGGEGLAEERAERDVLPGLDVAGRPVVERAARRRRGRRSRPCRPARRSASGRRPRSRARSRCRAGRWRRTRGWSSRVGRPCAGRRGGVRRCRRRPPCRRGRGSRPAGGASWASAARRRGGRSCRRCWRGRASSRSRRSRRPRTAGAA